MHTKEPWRIVNCDVVPSDRDDGLRLIEIRAGEVMKSPHKNSVAGYIDCGGRYVASCLTRAAPEAEASAARIVSCVNALAGLNPDAVADVVAALEACHSTLEHTRAFMLQQHGTTNPAREEALALARTALARIRGEG